MCNCRGLFYEFFFFLIYEIQESFCCSGNMNAQREPFGLGKEPLLIKTLRYRHVLSCFVLFSNCHRSLLIEPGAKHFWNMSAERGLVSFVFWLGSSHSRLLLFTFWRSFRAAQAFGL